MLDACSPSSRRSLRERPVPDHGGRGRTAHGRGPLRRGAAPHALPGDTPLHLAAAGLRYDAARALLAVGTPVNAVNRRGAAALHYACDPRPLSPTWDPAAQQRIIELLVSAGATVDLPDRGGVTPLHRAVRARSPAAVAALLSGGADPHAATSKAGSTPLHLAVAPTGASGTAGVRRPPARDRPDAPRRRRNNGRRGSQRRSRGRPDPEPGAARRLGRRATVITRSSQCLARAPRCS